MSGYWQAIAAAARGGSKARGDAAPVPSDPLFAPEAGDETEDWGAVDIEAAAPAASPPRRAAPEADMVPPAAESAAPTHAPVAAAAPAVGSTAAEPVEDRPDAGASAALPVDARPADASVAAAPMAAVPAPDAVAPSPVETDSVPPQPVHVPVSEPVPVVTAADAVADAAERAEPAAALPVEAAPVVVTVEASPVAAAESGLTMFDGEAADAAADLPPPIHIHIDRIDIRLSDGDAVAPRAAPRRAAPAVALDEFLRRPSERNG